MSLANQGKALLVVASVAVIAAVVAAIVIEPPDQVRKKRLDDRRVQDLWHIESAVSEYWKRHEALPPSLGTLPSEGLQASVSDPETNLPYEYVALTEDSYRVCAHFAMETGNSGRRAWPAQAVEWSHPAGRHCFERTVQKGSLQGARR